MSTHRTAKFVAGVAFFALWMWFGAQHPIGFITTLTITSMVLAWSFVILYAVRSPWRRTTVGRSLMYVWLSLAVVLTLVSTSYFFGDYPYRNMVRLVVYSSLPIAFAKFIRVLLAVQAGRLRGEIPRRVEADL